MSYRLLLSSLAASAVLSMSALGADTPPTPPTFDDAKAHHLARLQKEITCVEAAANFEEMHACMPPPPGGRMGPPPHG
jgi:hypothetical protein